MQHDCVMIVLGWLIVQAANNSLFVCLGVRVWAAEKLSKRSLPFAGDNGRPTVGARPSSSDMCYVQRMEEVQWYVFVLETGESFLAEEGVC